MYSRTTVPPEVVISCTVNPAVEVTRNAPFILTRSDCTEVASPPSAAKAGAATLRARTSEQTTVGVSFMNTSSQNTVSLCLSDRRARRVLSWRRADHARAAQDMEAERSRPILFDRFRAD